MDAFSQKEETCWKGEIERKTELESLGWWGRS